MPDGTRLAHVTIEPTRNFDLDRVDLLLGERRIRGMASAASSYLCTSGDVYHLSFVATPDETPTLSYYWYRGHHPPMYESRSVPSLPEDEPPRFVFSPESEGVVRSPFPLARSAVRLDPRDATAGRRWLERLASGPSHPPHPRACLPELMRLPDIERLRLSLNLAAGPEERLEYTFSLDAAPGRGASSEPVVE